MSKSKKASMTKAQKEQKKQYKEFMKIYQDTIETFTLEQSRAFAAMIDVFKENYATDQCIDFAMWMKGYGIALDVDITEETILNTFIKFKQSKFDEMRKEMAKINKRTTNIPNITKKDLKSAISKVKKSKDPKVLNTLKTQLDRLNAIGGLKSVVPSEGITFVFKGKLYKYTGAFAPANQILGMLKFV